MENRTTREQVMYPTTPTDTNFQATILHLDMDAFFAAVEQADNPELRGNPVIIGQSLRGVASAASYEARRYGVHSAMPIAQAKKLCPNGVFLPGRMARYREVSHQIMAVMERLCPVVEQASVDEAYADIGGTDRLHGSPRHLAEKLKQEVLTATGLTCSVGIAPNKFLAKIASDWNKPDGLTIIVPEGVTAFLHDLPVAKIPGVGRQLAEELARMGVRMVPDVLRHRRAFWIEQLGKRGAILHDRALGRDDRRVCPDIEAKSCSAENTFATDTLDRRELERWLLRQADRIGRELRRMDKSGCRVSLKLKFHDFTCLTRNTTLKRPTNLTPEIFAATRALLAAQNPTKPVRLIGTGVSQFRSGQVQLPLAVDRSRSKQECLDRTMDRIRDKFGAASIARAEATMAGTSSCPDLLSQKNRITTTE